MTELFSLLAPEILRNELLFLTICSAIIGAAFGSFLNVVIWRLPLGMSLIRPGSHCPKCKHPLGMFDNIPIFGWLLLRGKCRYCKEPISLRYPTIETICCMTAGIFAGAILLGGWTGPEHSLLYWKELADNFSGLPILTDGTDLSKFNFVFVQKGLVFAAIWTGMFLLELACGLIQHDGKTIPRSLLLVILFYLIFVYAAAFWFNQYNGQSFGSIVLATLSYLLSLFIFICGTIPFRSDNEPIDTLALFALLIPFTPYAILALLFLGITAVQFFLRKRKSKLSTGILICLFLPIVILVASLFPQFLYS